MRIADQPMSAPMPAARTRPLLLTFIAAVVLSASLLFMVQPMFTKLVLPRFGGAPSVWSVAIVFFQTALLAGYAYAHWLTRYAPGRPSVAIHLVVMGVAMFALPLSIATGWERPPAGAEGLWLVGLLAVSIGLPFFAIAANSPLLQAWFARTDHPAAQDPYFLYAASNVGSFLALVAYPTVIEPFVGLDDQARAWSIGFCLLVVLLAACGGVLWRSPDATARAEATIDAPPTWKDAAFWAALAAVPAGLLVAVTAHISTDVAAVPLLWTLPLALYLRQQLPVFRAQLYPFQQFGSFVQCLGQRLLPSPLANLYMVPGNHFFRDHHPAILRRARVVRIIQQSSGATGRISPVCFTAALVLRERFLPGRRLIPDSSRQ